MVEIGTKVVVNYGAGISKEYGVVTALKNDGVNDYWVVEGDGFIMTAHTIDKKSVNGSSIGVWVDTIDRS